MGLHVYSWNVNTYTISTWTTLLTATTDTIVRAISIACGGNAATIQIQMVDATGALLSTIVPPSSLSINEGAAVDLQLISVLAGNKIQVMANVSGVTFSASGAA